MLENRSFDHLLGWPEIEGTTVPIDPDDPASGRVPTFALTPPEAFRTEPDPGHEFLDVQLQLFGRTDPPEGARPTNDGFVLSYSQRVDDGGEVVGPSVGRKILGCFAPDDLPVLRTLTREFVLCDRWFASVPGPTWPNREFVHAGTSRGRVTSPTATEMFWGFRNERTIFHSLMEGDRTWKIYYHDVPQAFWFRDLVPYKDTNFDYFDEFDPDVQSGRLPHYSFIEPRYFPSHVTGANDQHPPHDVRRGEELIAAVYASLRRNADVWRRSLLIVTWDEHGGFYDREPPPETVSPDGRRPEGFRFAFDRLGVRVPAVIVSPWVAKGAVDHTLYDHTAIPAFLKKQFQLAAFLHDRDRAANTFEHLFQADCRDDAPRSLGALLRGAGRARRRTAIAETVRAPSDYQSLLMLQTAIVAQPITRREAAAHVTAQMRALAKAGQRVRASRGGKRARRRRPGKPRG